MNNIYDKVIENMNLRVKQQENIKTKVEKIYSKIPNNNNKLESNVGLVVGKIQSGKTSNIIALSAKVLDNEYKMVIMFLSDMNNLLTQNYDRIKFSFKGVDGVEVFKQGENGDFETLEEEELNYLYRNNKKIIICSLKKSKRIEDIIDVVKNTGYIKDHAMIIDDEGDDISQNTAKGKYNYDSNGKPIEEDRSSTNQSIVNLKNLFKKCSYISVTATPEVQLFLQNFQCLAPNFCETLIQGDGYTGLVTFHSEDSNLVQVIDDFNELNNKKGIPASLNDAFVLFICGCIIRKKREKEEFKHSMMIHNSKINADHGRLYNKILTYIRFQKNNVAFNNKSGQQFVELIKEKYEKITNRNDINRDDVVDVFNSLKIHRIDGNDKKATNDLKQLMRTLPYHIIIGGDMLDRGITIDGLAVSYMIRYSKIGQMDTVLQRARWFGYKSDYLDVCKVYLPEELKRQYNELIEAEDSIWDFMEQCSEISTDMRNEKLELTIDTDKLKPASKSKVKLESIYGNGSLSKNIVQRHFIRNKTLNDENIKLYNEFDWDYAKEFEKYNSGIQKHRYLEISLDKCIEFIKAFNFPDKNGDQKIDYNKDQIINRIKEYYNKIEDPNNSIQLLDMRYESKEERSISDDEDNKISGLLQGRSEKNKNDEDYYPGDGYLAEDRIIVQIHHVVLKDNYKDQYKIGDEILMLCINMPKNYTIKNIVRRADILDIQRNFI